MPRDRDLVTGSLAAVVAASLFGMLGPLARFGAEAGVEGLAFASWRATLGLAFLAVLIVGAATRRVVGRLDRAPRPARQGGAVHRGADGPAAQRGGVLGVRADPDRAGPDAVLHVPRRRRRRGRRPRARDDHAAAPRRAPAVDVGRRAPARGRHDGRRRRADQPARRGPRARGRRLPGRVHHDQPRRLPDRAGRRGDRDDHGRVDGRRGDPGGDRRPGRQPHRAVPDALAVAGPAARRGRLPRASRRCCS